MNDFSSLAKIVSEVKPDEIYNLAAQSHVKVSFEIPIYTSESTAIGALNLLEAVKNHSPSSKVYQASSSEMYGNAPAPQNEDTPFLPESPYAISKLFAYWQSENYKNACNLFISNGILFNHESLRRGETFVTRKISRAVARIHLGLQESLTLGNLESVRDWGFAPEYVRAMWLMLQLDVPENFVISTGKTATVKEFAEAAFATLDLNFEDYVLSDERYRRPTEVNFLQGDSSKAKIKLDWSATTYWNQLAQIMVEGDLNILKKQLSGEIE
jgi:GDPmannose 4,6-dehydratase